MIGPEERREDPERDGDRDQPRVLDPPPCVLVHPVRGREPEGDGEEDRDVADDEPDVRVEEVSDALEEVVVRSGGRLLGQQHRLGYSLPQSRILPTR